MTWLRDGGDAGQFAVRNGGRVLPQLAQSEVVMSKISLALKGKAERKWERGGTRGEGEVVVSAVALVKAAMLMLVVVLTVASTLLLLLLLFEPLVTGSTGGA